MRVGLDEAYLNLPNLALIQNLSLQIQPFPRLAMEVEASLLL